MIKAAIVGSGKIAAAHAWAISLIPDTEIVGVCDNEDLMAIFQRYPLFVVLSLFFLIRRKWISSDRKKQIPFHFGGLRVDNLFNANGQEANLVGPEQDQEQNGNKINLLGLS